MSWQKCTVCDGSGTVLEFFTGKTMKCQTCQGHRIINDITGKPPEGKTADAIGSLRPPRSRAPTPSA